MRWMIVLLVALLTGCARAPILIADVPAEDVTACQSLADGAGNAQGLAQRALVGGVTRGILGKAVESAVGATALKLKILSFSASGTFTAGTLAGALALMGIAEGVADGLLDQAKERERITRECLRDRGHRAY